GGDHVRAFQKTLDVNLRMAGTVINGPLFPDREQSLGVAYGHGGDGDRERHGSYGQDGAATVAPDATRSVTHGEGHEAAGVGVRLRISRHGSFSVRSWPVRAASHDPSCMPATGAFMVRAAHRGASVRPPDG